MKRTQHDEPPQSSTSVGFTVHHDAHDHTTSNTTGDEGTASEVTANAKQHVERALDTGSDALHQVQAGVAQEREPRWRVLLRGRYILAAYILALLALAGLAVAAHAHAVLPGDLPLTRELQESRSPVVFWLFSLISAIGFAVPSAIIEILAVLTLWLLRLRLESIFLVLTLLADLLGGVLKIVVGRHRPTSDLVHVVQQIQQPSFPSGHTLHYTVFYGFLFFVIATNFKSSWPRNSALVICALLVLLVGPSRVYLGEHWPTDVLGGYLVGALCLAPLIAGYLWAKAHLTVTASPPWIRRIPPVSAEPPAADGR
jgi:membrane-associated phospholipid phosphatase